MIPFDQYYLKYLGIDQERLKAGHQVFPCERRARTFGFFYTYHLISTVIDGSVVFSISPKFAPAFDSRRKALSDICEIFTRCLQKLRAESDCFLGWKETVT